MASRLTLASRVLALLTAFALFSAASCKPLPVPSTGVGMGRPLKQFDIRLGHAPAPRLSALDIYRRGYGPSKTYNTETYTTETYNTNTETETGYATATGYAPTTEYTPETESAAYANTYTYTQQGASATPSAPSSTPYGYDEGSNTDAQNSNSDYNGASP